MVGFSEVNSCSPAYKVSLDQLSLDRYAQFFISHATHSIVAHPAVLLFKIDSARIFLKIYNLMSARFTRFCFSSNELVRSKIFSVVGQGDMKAGRRL